MISTGYSELVKNQADSPVHASQHSYSTFTTTVQLLAKNLELGNKSVL